MPQDPKDMAASLYCAIPLWLRQFHSIKQNYSKAMFVVCISTFKITQCGWKQTKDATSKNTSFAKIVFFFHAVFSLKNIHTLRQENTHMVVFLWIKFGQFHAIFSRTAWNYKILFISYQSIKTWCLILWI